MVGNGLLGIKVVYMGCADEKNNNQPEKDS